MIPGIKKDIKAEFLSMIAKVNEKNPYYLVIGVLVLVLLLDYFLIMQFQLGALRKMGSKLTEIKSEIERFETNYGRINKYKSEIQMLDDKLEGLQNRIARTEDISAVLEGLSRMANSNKVFVEQLLPDTNWDEPVLEDEEGRYFLLPVAINAKGGYHNFGRFLNDLEERGTLMKIAQIEIAASSDNPRQHLIKFLIEAVIFEAKGEGGK